MTEINKDCLATKQKRTKPIIEKISLSPDQQKALEDYLALFNKSTEKYCHVISRNNRRRHIISIVGKLCSFCDGIPSYQVSYHFEGIIRLERFCDSCWGKKEERERDAKEYRKSFETNPDIINDINMQESITSQNY